MPSLGSSGIVKSDEEYLLYADEESGPPYLTPSVTCIYINIHTHIYECS